MMPFNELISPNLRLVNADSEAVLAVICTITIGCPHYIDMFIKRMNRMYIGSKSVTEIDLTGPA